MIDRMCWRSALGLSLVIACGSGSSSNGPGDNPGADGGADGGAQDDGATPDGGVGAPDVLLDSAPDGAACGAAACTGVAGACGAMVDPCGQDVTCEPCRYTPEPVTDGEDAPVALALAPDPVAAVRDQLGTRAGGAWSFEPVLAAGTSVVAADLALAPDGTPWVAYVTDSISVSVAHKSGSTWTTDSLGAGEAVAIAIASDGTPYVAIAVNTPAGVTLASYTAGAWNKQNVAGGTPIRVDLAMHGTEPHLAWWDRGDSTIKYAHGAPVAVENAATGVGSNLVIDVALALDGQGRPHIAYFPSDMIYHAVKDGGAWTQDKVADLFGYGSVRIAASAQGDLAIGWISDVDGLSVAFGFGKKWSPARVLGKCSSHGKLDMAFDPAAKLKLLHSCASNVTLLTQDQIYPSGYNAACDAVARTMCDEACNCPRGGFNTCCVTDGKQYECDGTASGCAFGPQGVRRYDCGNASQDPAVLYACQSALPQASCADSGVLVPPSCTTLFH